MFQKLSGVRQLCYIGKYIWMIQQKKRPSTKSYEILEEPSLLTPVSLQWGLLTP